MKSIRLNLRGQSDNDLALFAANHARQADARPEVFTGLFPAGAAYGEIRAAYETKLAELMAAAQLYKKLVGEKNRARVALENALRSRARGVAVIAGKNKATVVGVGFKPAVVRGPRIGPLPAPKNVRAAMGSFRGRIDLKWPGLKGAECYVMERRTLDGTGGPWGNQKLVTMPRASISGLTSGVEYAFRIRAVGAAGEGPWSSEVVRMAP